jgi:hypothetical protein
MVRNNCYNNTETLGDYMQAGLKSEDEMRKIFTLQACRF